MTFGATTIVAEDIIEVSIDDAPQAQALAKRLRQDPMFDEVVPALTCVAVMFRPGGDSRETAHRLIRQALSDLETETEAPPMTLTLPVIYGGEAGPDLGQVARHVGVSPEELVKTHTEQTFTVDMLGFTPGFAYLSGLPWSVPRLDTPRTFVPAGSVGVTGGRTGLYSLGGPGGWPLIGRTNTELFLTDHENPFVLEPGALVRFHSVVP